MSAQCRIRLLGGLQAACGDRVITRFRTHKTAGLLAYLAYFLDRPHPREVLADLFWPASEPRAGQASLRVALASLRRQLEPPGTPAGAVLIIDRFTVQLNASAVSTDVREFEAALQRAERTEGEAERRRHLDEALARYRGALLPGRYEDWITAEQERLADRYFATLQAVTEGLEEAGDVEAALEQAWRAVAVEPLREEGHQRLMRLLAAAGRPEAALRHYRDLERLLRDELGERPTPATAQLAQELSNTSPPVRTARPTAPSAPGALPTGMVTFLLADPGADEAVRQAARAGAEAMLRRRRAQVCKLFRGHGGHDVPTGRGYLVAAFARAEEALRCGLACQQELRRTGPAAAPIRFALDTGEAGPEGGRYPSAALERAARLLLAAHQGQFLCSEVAASLLRRAPEPDVAVVELGVFRLTDQGPPERVFAVVPAEAGPEALARPRAALASASNLPPQFTRFFGREREAAHLRTTLKTEGRRLVTLTGPPGCGKTRLALEVANQLTKDLHGAVWFVPLQEATDPSVIVDSIRESLHLPQLLSADPLSQIADLLSLQPSLLVLDNFEQLLGGGALEVRKLLERAPTLRCLVTSRRGLDLEGELQFLLDPLPTPKGKESAEELIQCPSVALFVDRAQAVRPDFQLTAGTARVTSELCSQLEGIPLALELAAGRAQVLTPSQMLSQLQRRFDLLVSRRRDVGDRHRTLHGAVEWSYRLLPKELQRFFRQLSAFRGGWSVAAAASVCEQKDALECLTQLEECSLIRAEMASEGEPRFRMLETLREYGDEMLTRNERAAVHQRHAGYYLALAQDSEANQLGTEREAVTKRLVAEVEDCRAALAWFLSAADGAEPGLRLAAALRPVWSRRGGFAEGKKHLAAALARRDAAAHPAARARALWAEADLAFRLGELTAARALLEEGLPLARGLAGRRLVGDMLRLLGAVAGRQGAYAERRSFEAQARAVEREIGEEPETAHQFHWEAGEAGARGDYAAARSAYLAAAAQWRDLGNLDAAATAMTNAGYMVFLQGNYEEATRLFDEGLLLGRETGNLVLQGFGLANLGEVALARGDLAAAQLLFTQSLTLAREVGEDRLAAESLACSGQVSWRGGDCAQARAYLEEALDVTRQRGMHPEETGVLVKLVPVYLDQGDLARAQPLVRILLERGIELRRQGDSAVASVPGLEACAAFCLAAGRTEAAARLLGAAESVRNTAGIPVDPLARWGYDRQVTRLRSALRRGALAAARAEGTAMTPEQATSYALAQIG